MSRAHWRTFVGSDGCPAKRSANGSARGGSSALLALSLMLLGLACSVAPPASPPAAKPPAAGPAEPAVAPTSPPAAVPVPARQPELVRITDIQITSAAGSYIAAAKGYFEAEGIRVEFVPVSTADQIPALVAG